MRNSKGLDVGLSVVLSVGIGLLSSVVYSFSGTWWVLV